MGARVLVIEDDEAIGEELAGALRANGYTTTLTATGAGALDAARPDIDLVLLDLGLPDLDGIPLARQLRVTMPDTVIVVLTARTDELDVISALDAGADDYLTKPFRLAELLARVRAHLRRQASLETGAPATAGDLTVDPRTRTATVGGAPLNLRPKEFELLTVLVGSAGEAVRRETLMSTVWDENWFGSTKTLDVHVAALRRKLGTARSSVRITTLRGYGYRVDSSS